MKKLLLLSLALVFLFACEKRELNDPEKKALASACGFSNPTEELAWLKAEIEKADTPTTYCTPTQVVQGVYKDKTVFIIPVSGALCCTCAGSMVYDCEGKNIFVCKPEEEAKIKNKKVIWEK